jgi:predicted transcriptional regulator
MDSRNTLFVSLKPRFATMLLDGTKTVELRRVRPDVSVGAPVLLYASSPTRALVGTATVDAIDVGSVLEIWQRHRGDVGVTSSEFEDYFAGAAAAVAISLRNVAAIPGGEIPLSELRRRRRGFRPPQSFRYFDSETAAALV